MPKVKVKVLETALLVRPKKGRDLLLPTPNQIGSKADVGWGEAMIFVAPWRMAFGARISEAEGWTSQIAAQVGTLPENPEMHHPPPASSH